MYVILDSEMNGLKPTKVHVIVVKEKPANVIRIFTKEPFMYKGVHTETFDTFAQLSHTTYTKYSIHNGIHYDVPNIKKLIPDVNISWDKVFDTLVASRLANQERQGGHSMANWGVYLGLNKVEHDDWETLTEDMITRCIGDVELGDLIDQVVRTELKGFSKLSLDVEHEVCEICRRIEAHGFRLDYDKCTNLLSEVDGLKNKLHTDLALKYPRLPKLKREVEYKITAKGVLHSNTTKPLGEHGNTVTGPYSLIDWVEFNPGSRQQIAEQLMRIGWKPQKYTEPTKNHPKGQPKVDETTLLEAAESIPEAKDIAQFLMLGKRSSQISGWLELYNFDTKRVHGRIHHIGAKTHRASHADPNLAQVPSVPHGSDGSVLRGLEGTFSYECRDVWTVPPGYSLVGVDASAIQLVILAHAMGNEEFAKAVAFGDKKQGTDVHSMNRNTLRNAVTELMNGGKWDNIDRDKAKTFIYAFLLGAGGAKVDQILTTVAIGNKVKELFVKRTPGLGELQEALREACHFEGRIRNIDGRYFPCDNPHFALAYVLQGYEQAIMKMAMIKLQRWIDETGIDAHIVAWVHDEFQIEVRNINDLPKLVSDMTVKFIEEVGKELQLKCHLTGEGKYKGVTWASSH